jgi:hypothetical protein
MDNNTALAIGIIGTLLESAMKYQILLSRAQAEDRDITDDELDNLRAESQRLHDELMRS